MPTIKDIAREAGVSHGTVSNVLNKTGKVSLEKIRLVEEAAKRLDYVPNVQAQQLRQRMPVSVAVILPSLAEDTYLDFYTALQSFLAENGYETLIYTTDDIEAKEEAVLDKLPTSSLAALVTVSCMSQDCCKRYNSFPCPVIFAERAPIGLEKYNLISFDFFFAGTELGHYALSHAKKRIAFFTSPNSCSNHQLLLNGLKKELAGSEASIWTFSSDLNLSLNKAFDIVQSSIGFDTVITTSSLRAQAVISALRLCPKDLTPEILTLSSVKPYQAAGITSYGLDYSQLGAKVSDLIMQHLQHKKPLPAQTILRTKGFPYHFPYIKKMESQTLTMLTIDTPSTNALKKILPMFEQASGISVKLINMPYEDLHTQLGIHNPDFHYDLVRMDVAKLDSLGEKVYLPLENAGISAENLPPKLISGAYDIYSLINGTMYALPFDPSVQIFLYRSDLFHNAMLQRSYYERYRESLTVPTTITQYIRIAEFFTASDNNKSPTVFGATATCGSAATAASDFLPYYLSEVPQIWQKNLSIRIDTKEMVHAMTQYQQLSHYASRQQWWIDSVRQFADGATATAIIYSNYASGIINSKHSSVVGRVGAAVVPGQKPLLGGGVIGISRYSTHIEACRQFFQWYYSSDIASLLVHLGGTSPLVDAYNDFRNFSVFPWLSAAQKSFEKGTRGTGGTLVPGYSTPRYEFAIGTAIQNLINGIVAPEQAAEMAETMYRQTSL